MLPEKTSLINFRVSDLDGMVERLRTAGVAVEPHAETYPYGRFADLEDPEGNRFSFGSRTRSPRPAIRAERGPAEPA